MSPVKTGNVRVFNDNPERVLLRAFDGTTVYVPARQYAVVADKYVDWQLPPTVRVTEDPRKAQ